MSGLLLGSISATLGLDNSGFRRGIAESEALTQTFGSTFSTVLVNPLLAGIGAMKSFGAAVLASSERLLGMAESAQRTSTLTGVSVETIQSLRNTLGDMGLSAEGADAALTAFNRKLGDAKKDGGATAKSLAQLGVDLSNVGTGEKALRAIFDQLSRIDDVGQRAAAAAEIFDKQFGAQILAAVEGGAKGLEKLNREMLATGRTLDSITVGSLVAIDDRVDALKGRLEGLSNTLTGEFLQGLVGGLGDTDGAVNDLATSLKNELGPAAKDLGKIMAELVIALRGILDMLKEIKAIDKKVTEAGPLKHINDIAEWNFTRGVDQVRSLVQGDIGGFFRAMFGPTSTGKRK